MNHRSLAAVLVGVAAIAAVAWPLLVYSTSLAIFGLAHALVELRVLDVRYRPRLGQGPWRAVALALAAIFVVRVAANLGLCSRSLAHVVELAGGVAATLAVVPWILRRRAAAGRTAIAVAIALGCGAVLLPLPTLLVLAVLHNLTPWPLLVDALQPRERRRARWIGAVVFVVVPAVIVTGAPYVALAQLGVTSPEATVLPTGPLFDQFSAFWGPPPLDYPTLALHVFSACAYLQCAHYVAVLLLLPRVGPTARQVPVRTVLAVVGLGVVVAAAYAVDFVGARAWYGTIAGVHAWAEFPALLVAWATWRE